MKIDGLRLLRVGLRRVDPAWRTSLYSDTTVDGFVLEVRAGGVVGLGATAALALQIGGDDLEAQLRRDVLPRLRGADALEGTAIRAAIRDAGVHPRTLLAADLALHDLLGRAAGLPCHVLWGGPVTPGIDVVRMIGLKPPDDLAAAADVLVADGFHHLKLKIAGVFDEDLARIRAVRSHVGPEVGLEVDANGAYDAAGAIRLAEELDGLGVRIFEQPVPARDLEALHAVTLASPVPVMADQGVMNVADALEICRRGAARMISIKLVKMGTIDECRRVADVCAAFGVGVRVGGSAAPAVVDMAQVHLAVAVPALAAPAEVAEFLSVTDDPCQAPRIISGRLAPAAEPGFGLGLGPGGRLVEAWTAGRG
jgi:L-alanine-DL-glutamate epimerase-like enolase superfamily enzyme